MPLALLSVAFSGLQGALATFVVTWLVSKHGVPLPQAGTIFALMQGTGMAARLVLGWLADRLGRPSRALAAQAFAVAGIGAALGLLPVGSSVVLCLACGGRHRLHRRQLERLGARGDRPRHPTGAYQRNHRRRRCSARPVISLHRCALRPVLVVAGWTASSVVMAAPAGDRDTVRRATLPRS
jgi:hypothetical protein